MNPIRIWPERTRRSTRPAPRLRRVEVLETRLALSRGTTADDNLEYLGEVMDRYHTTIPVYEDVGSPGNRFHAYGEVGDVAGAVEMNGSDVSGPHSGATAIRATFRNFTGLNWGGYFFQNGVLLPGERIPRVNFGSYSDAGVNLTGVNRLTFWARGATGHEQIEFFIGGVGRDPAGNPVELYPDSAVRYPSVGTVTALSTEWRKYTIEIPGSRDMSYVLGGFGWAANAPSNPLGATFFLDDIRYELNEVKLAQRLDEPRFLTSYTTLPTQSVVVDGVVDEFDLVLRNTAFSYDNALALLAFLADANPATRAESLHRASLIGDAFAYAATHDRFFTDGRIRTAYASGDISLPPGWTPNGRTGTVPVPGYYRENGGFTEILQKSVDVGNNAWVMIAMLALHRRTGNPAYLDVAQDIGAFIRMFRQDTGIYQGFLGGIENPESPDPVRRQYASSEHNIDIFAAASLMYDATRDVTWLADAEHAFQFVEAMWDAELGLYLTGTTDPSQRNTKPGQLPVDVQAWAVLALPGVLTRHPGLFASTDDTFLTTCGAVVGYDFNDNLDGVWFEGTAHVALAKELSGLYAEAALLRQTLTDALDHAPEGNVNVPGTPAACRDRVDSGFEFNYFRRDHIGASAWNVFAQLSFNPYQDWRFLPGDSNEDGQINHRDLVTIVANYGRPTGATYGGGDINGDGKVSLLDVREIQRRWNRTVDLDHARTSETISPSAAAVDAAVRVKNVVPRQAERRSARAARIVDEFDLLPVSQNAVRRPPAWSETPARRRAEVMQR